MTLRLHRQHMGIASFLAHLCDAVRAADQKPRLDDADIKKQPDPENGHAYPQSALPGRGKLIAPPYHVEHTRCDGDNREQHVADVPGFVAQL